MLPKIKRMLGMLVLITAIPIGLTGCWSKQELNDRTFVSTMLVDLNEDGQTEVSTLFMLPNRISNGLNSNSVNQKPYVSISGKGSDVAEALQHIQAELPRSVTWGQMQVIVIGDRFARAGLTPLLDHLIRATDFRLPIYVFYFNGFARNLAKLESVFERFPTEIWRESAHTKRVPPIRIRDLLYARWNNLGDSYIPELTLRDLKLLTEAKNVKWSGVGGAAILKNGAVTGRFTNDETMGILMMKNQIPEMIITGELPDNKGVFSARLIDVKHRTRAIRNGNRVTLQVTLRAKADLISIESNMNLNAPANISIVEKAVSDRIRHLIQSASEKAQDHQADVFQWSELVKYKYPGMWQEWSENPREMMFTLTDPEFQVHVVLRSTGISRSAKL
ncbi:Ger(x)C family spore germination protein [Paenibacillus qinlingensis]|uniref:Ger(X)C family germination protein n=1 Tax=Paenibacillus qinlingensis TaxID=1837343 RepID=A0ABU1P3H4_9BACL|nr:Ger(x)C family spore germination protein [Paenibacillus qinlingensis]MDR6554293.1 Ger(x)C family germination protein [Paenibacillus qinlingensis]